MNAPAVLHCRDRELEWGKRTLIMGVLNVTPDSFSDGGRYLDPDAALQRAHALIQAGADIIDVGGESSRPGADPVASDEEIRRVLPVISSIARDTNAVISIDTTKPGVARAALDAGAHVINDISGGAGDGMFELARDYRAGLVLMHMQGAPRTMQEQPVYEDVTREVVTYLQQRRTAAITAGINPTCIALDPGIGFGKTFDHNWTLLNNLPSVTTLGAPVLVGCSRKRFLGALCNREVNERLPAGLAALTVAILRGAAIIRVHDVKESCDAARVADRIRSEGAPQ